MATAYWNYFSGKAPRQEFKQNSGMRILDLTWQMRFRHIAES